MPNRNSTALFQDLLVWCGNSWRIAAFVRAVRAGLRCNYCYHTATSWIREYPYVFFRCGPVNNLGTDHGKGIRTLLRCILTIIRERSPDVGSWEAETAYFAGITEALGLALEREAKNDRTERFGIGQDSGTSGGYGRRSALASCLKGTERVLDLGCGNGKVTAEIAAQFLG